MTAETANAFITLAAAIGQLGIAAAALKVAVALKSRQDRTERRVDKHDEILGVDTKEAA